MLGILYDKIHLRGDINMDIFVEQIVRRKRQFFDYIKLILCLIAVSIIVPLMLFSSPGFVGTIIFFAGAALIYAIYNVGISINLEYEYCFTNGALDVDKIIAARRRKRLTEVNARDIDIMASTKSHNFKDYINNREVKKVYACSSIADDGVYFVVYTVNGQKRMLLFNPNDTIKDGFRRLSPQKVILED